MIFSTETWAAIGAIASFIVSILTAIYVLYTKKISEFTAESAKLASYPLLIPFVNRVYIGEKFNEGKRQNASVEYKIQNIGNAPAVNVFIDCEFECLIESHRGERIFSQRFEPEFLNFVKKETEIDGPSFSFGNEACAALLKNFRASDQKNMERINNNPTDSAFKSVVFRIFIYYSSVNDKFFRAVYEFHAHPFANENSRWSCPDRDENIKISPFYIPKPKFSARTIEFRQIQKEIEKRDKIRDRSGW